MNLLVQLFDTLATEPGFGGAVLHENLDRPDELVVYETWEFGREQYLSDVRTRPYWDAYEARLSDLCVKREASWLSPVAEWKPSSP